MDVRDYIEANAREYFDALKEWLTIPSISADPERHIGLRGCVTADIDMIGPERDLHSGSFGGAVPNPLHAMAALLAGLHDAHGRVMLPGFYDKVAPLSDRERDLIGRLPFSEKDWLASAGNSQAASGEEGFSGPELTAARNADPGAGRTGIPGRD
jgi:acetylornithine deacetylase/succinyl-diaminopimelate desuccinylase-like protein